eukprot:15470678-Alexandrium_andersonii.AAC.1
MLSAGVGRSRMRGSWRKCGVGGWWQYGLRAFLRGRGGDRWQSFAVIPPAAVIGRQWCRAVARGLGVVADGV